MSLVVGTQSYTLTAADIVKGALELCQVVSIDEPVGPEDMQTCLRALNGILKELPLHGIGWPKVSSADTSIAWLSSSPSTVSVPADYFGVPVLRYTDANGKLQPLAQLAKVKYEELDSSATGTYPRAFYIAPNNTIYLWPVPTQDPGLKLSYQSIVSDATMTGTPDVQQAFLSGLESWVAQKVKLKFNVAPQLSSEIEKLYLEQRELMKQWSVETAPISFTADDRCYPEFRGWP